MTGLVWDFETGDISYDKSRNVAVGGSWDAFNTVKIWPTAPVSVSDLAVAASNNLVQAGVAFGSGLVITYDGWLSRRVITDPSLNNIRYLGISPVNPHYQIGAANASYVVITTDGWDTWTTTDVYVYGRGITISSANDKEQWIFSEPPLRVGEILHTTDGWVTYDTIVIQSSTKLRFRHVAISPTDPLVQMLSCADGEFFVTTDGWQTYTSPILGLSGPGPVAVDSNNPLIQTIAPGGSAPYTTTDGWQTYTTGTIVRNWASLQIVNGLRQIAVASGSYMYTTENGWATSRQTPVPGPKTWGVLKASISDPTVMVAVNNDSYLYKTYNVYRPFLSHEVDNQTCARIATEKVCRLTYPELGVEMGARLLNRHPKYAAELIAEAERQVKKDGAIDARITRDGEQFNFYADYGDV